jgi:hypothetical protein
VWREIEIAANRTLAELGEAIPLAFAFDDPHLWSFFLSDCAWDHESECALQSEPDPFGGPRARAARRTLIRDVPWPGASGKKEVLFLFDYGDEWHFGVKLMRQSPTVETGARYPRVVAQQGDAPPQHPDPDEEEWMRRTMTNGDQALLACRRVSQRKEVRHDGDASAPVQLDLDLLARHARSR